MSNNLSEIKTALINGLSTSNKIKNDEDLRQSDIGSLGRHISDYDNILRNYATHVDKTLKHKRIMKAIFFGISAFTMVSCVLIVGVCVLYLLNNIFNESFDILNYATPAITAITSFLTVYIIIPKIIAKYLFNSKEDDAMKNIIASIQDYDKYIRNSLHNKD